MKVVEKVQERAAATKRAFSSLENFKRALLVEESAGFANTNSKYFVWSNKDMDPTPIEERTWKWWNYGAVWFAYSFSPGVWSLGSAMIASGLTVGEAVGCVFVAHLLGAIGMSLNSRLGATYHVGFPVAVRSSFGGFGSYFPILMRCANGIVWIGVLVYQGGQFLGVAFRCIFGEAWHRVPNTIPLSSKVTTQDISTTIIWWVCTLPILFIPVHKTRHLWTAKSIVLPPLVFGLFIYTQVMSSRTGINFQTIKHFSGSKLAWTMLQYINSSMGKTSGTQVNAADSSRYAINRQAPGLSQLIILPTLNTMVACLGIFATSAYYAQTGVLVWSPWGLLKSILDLNWNSGARFGVLLCSLGWCLSCLVSNQYANVIPFGADISALFPRVLNFKRGQLLAYCLGLAMCPWQILASATTFLTFLGGYSIFLGPLVGIPVVDYYLLRRGNIHVPSLYTGAKDSHYRYSFGINWRAQVAFWVGCTPTIPGFAGTFPGQKIGLGWVHLYYIGWLMSTLISAVVYFAISKAFPPAFMKEAAAAPFESWADEQQELLDRSSSVKSDAGSEGEKSSVGEKDPKETVNVLSV